MRPLGRSLPLGKKPLFVRAKEMGEAALGVSASSLDVSRQLITPFGLLAKHLALMFEIW